MLSTGLCSSVNGHIQDRRTRAAGKPPGTLPVIDQDPLKPSALPTADSYEFFSAWGKKSKWQNEVTVKRYDTCFSIGSN
jgi:hypothetical protein